ncbi:DNA polymerase [Bienertia sinuspersici]
MYDGETLTNICIRVYRDSPKDPGAPITAEYVMTELSSFLAYYDFDQKRLPDSTAKIRHRNQTILVKDHDSEEDVIMLEGDSDPYFQDAGKNNVIPTHIPYAVGVMVVQPGSDVRSGRIHTFFSEDYSPLLHPRLKDRSVILLKDFIHRVMNIVSANPKMHIVYFHNFSAFDGIFLIKHLVMHHSSLTLKPLMRNSRLYELNVYSGKKLLFTCRDSLNLLPGTLAKLGESLCPELGGKGSFDHAKLEVIELKDKKDEILTYLKQDILLLGGIMQKAQKLCWEQYSVDIEEVITNSSLSLRIFRSLFYDASSYPIHIPSRNEDKYIRRGYYGGHTDVYIRSGTDLYYYDVNSLYPFIMKSFSMPGGKPVWKGNLANADLSNLFGFIEAYVYCPAEIKRPFLPYRGEFVGVYYSEELKYAKSLGYTVIPLSGYIFEEMESPFKSYVSTLFESRLQAKKEGNDALSFVYKILMNSLYGRFGINPESTLTEICDFQRYRKLMQDPSFVSAYNISKENYIVSYRSNMDDEMYQWEPPKNSAVHISAAVTANARIICTPLYQGMTATTLTLTRLCWVALSLRRDSPR